MCYKYSVKEGEGLAMEARELWVRLSRQQMIILLGLMSTKSRIDW